MLLDGETSHIYMLLSFEKVSVVKATAAFHQGCSEPSCGSDTVDGSEIRRSTVEVGSLSHYLQGYCTFQVVQNLFHQQ